MIFKINPDCILYGQYLRELKSNFQFNDRVKKFCQMEGCEVKDLKFGIKGTKDGLEPTAKFIDGRECSFDWSGIRAEDLNLSPREKRGSNINRFLTSATKNKLSKPLNYDYFWLDKTLCVEVMDVGIPISFKIAGLVEVPSTEATIIGYIRGMAYELL